MSPKGTSRSDRPDPKKPWWLGAAVVYLCMFAAMMLAGTFTSALGTEARMTGKEENVPILGENLTFEIVTPEGLLSVENDIVVITFGFTNSTENTIDRTYVLNFEEQKENVPVSLAPGQSKQIPVQLSVAGLTTGIHTLSLVEDDHIVGAAILRWSPPPVADVIAHAITYAVALSVVYLHVTRFEGRKKFWRNVGITRENLTRSLIWVFALYVIFIAVNTVYWTFIGSKPLEVMTQFFAGQPAWYYGYLLFAFFIPVALTEELVFRGFMMKRFLVKGAAFAIVFSSFLFTSLHIWYLGFGLDALPLLSGLFILSMYWGIVYWKTRNIVGLIVFHGLYNAVTAVGLLFPGTGVDAIMGSAMFIFGMVCLGYLFVTYLIKLFTEIEQLVKGKGKA